ncbi:MAG: hypothetical protein ACYC24_03120 [Desulfobacteria bacterium]
MSGITAQVSLYPLGEDDLSPAIDAALREARRVLKPSGSLQAG